MLFIGSFLHMSLPGKKYLLILPIKILPPMLFPISKDAWALKAAQRLLIWNLGHILPLFGRILYLIRFFFLHELTSRGLFPSDLRGVIYNLLYLSEPFYRNRFSN